MRIIKKLSNDKLHNEIGDIFRKFNLIEFKAPNDYISINDFYKVLGKEEIKENKFVDMLL